MREWRSMAALCLDCGDDMSCFFGLSWWDGSGEERCLVLTAYAWSGKGKKGWTGYPASALAVLIQPQARRG